jgi:hypothetical protein
MRSRNSARRGGRRGEQPRTLGLPGCPSRASALRIATTALRIAAKRGHRATIATGSGEGVATEAIRPSRPPPHAPPPASASADRRRRIQPLARPELAALHRPPARFGRLHHEEGGGVRRKSPRPTGLPSAPPTAALPPPPDPAASDQTPAGSADPTHPLSTSLHRKPSTRFAPGRRNAARGEGEPRRHPHC